MTTLSTQDLAFHHRLARLLDRLDNGQFWPSLAQFLREFVPFKSWTAMVFHADKAPTVLGDSSLDLDETDDTLYMEYITRLYALDPFYQFSKTLHNPGLYQLYEVSPEYFTQTDYYRRYFSRNLVSDEIQFLIPAQGGGVLSLSIGSSEKFTTEQVGTLCLFTPWLLALMHRSTLSADVVETGPNTLPSHKPLDQWLRANAAPALTDREVQTTLLILAGHSAKSIAQKMGISAETVKTHKRHVYRKFGVSSPSALFALYLADE